MIHIDICFNGANYFIFLNCLGYGQTGINPSIRAYLFAYERHGSAFKRPEMHYFV
jgi:hypothetical protein